MSGELERRLLQKALENEQRREHQIDKLFALIERLQEENLSLKDEVDHLRILAEGRNP